MSEPLRVKATLIQAGNGMEADNDDNGAYMVFRVNWTDLRDLPRLPLYQEVTLEIHEGQEKT